MVDTVSTQTGEVQLALGEHAPGRLAQLRTDTGLKLPDCCVLLAAQDHDACVASFDTDLLKAAHKLGLAASESATGRATTDDRRGGA